MEQKDISAQETKPQYYKSPLFYLFVVGVFGLLWFFIDQLRFQLLSLGDIFLITGAGAFLLALAWMLLMQTTNKRTRLIGGLITLLIFTCAYLSSQVFDPIYSGLHKMAYRADTEKQVPGLYVSAQVPLKDLKQLNESTIGVLKDRTQVLTSHALESIRDEGAEVKTREYSSLQPLLRGLRGQAVRAVILSDSDLEAAYEYQDLRDFINELQLVESFEYDTTVKAEPADKDLYEDSFTVLVSASNTPLSQDAYVSDTVNLITVNPKTRKVYIVKLPRSLQIPMACPEGIDCPSGQQDKVSMASLYTLSALKASVEQFLGTTIDFTVRVDTNSLADLADLFGPVEVESAHGYTSGSYTFTEGKQEMNTSKIRQFVSDRNDFSSDDLFLASNVDNVMDALRQNISPKSILEYKPLMSTLSKSIKTTFSYHQLLQVLNMFELQDFHWDTESTQMGWNNAFEYSPGLTSPAFTCVPIPENVEEIKGKIAQVLTEEKKPEEKTDSKKDESKDENTNQENDSSENAEQDPNQSENPAGEDGTDSQEQPSDQPTEDESQSDGDIQQPEQNDGSDQADQ